MSTLDLNIIDIFHGDTPVLKVMKGDVQKWPHSPKEVRVDLSKLEQLPDWYINQNKWMNVTASGQSSKFLPVIPGATYRITPSTTFVNGCHCVFLTSKTHTKNATPPYCTSDTGWQATEYTAVAPANAVYLYIRYKRGGDVVEPSSITEITT